jgi:DNA/RNA endonuclease YhcR with UshA esterase domain
MKDAIFDPTGEKLWVVVKMTGLYYVTYTYQLWGSSQDDYPVLTKQPKANSNQVSVDDYYQLVNEYNSGEVLPKFHERVVKISLDVIKTKDDFGYIMSVFIFQAKEVVILQIMKDMYTPGYVFPVAPLSTDERNGKTGGKTLKEEKYYFMLKDLTK